jgi:hypothetical protein
MEKCDLHLRWIVRKDNRKSLKVLPLCVASVDPREDKVVPTLIEWLLLQEGASDYPFVIAANAVGSYILEIKAEMSGGMLVQIDASPLIITVRDKRCTKTAPVPNVPLLFTPRLPCLPHMQNFSLADPA